MNSPAPRALALRTTGVTYPGTPEHVRAVRAAEGGLMSPDRGRRHGLRRVFTLAGVFAVVAVVVSVLGVGGGVADANVTVVTVDPATAEAGSTSVTLTFRVPSQANTAGTVGFGVSLPADHPFADVTVQQVPGWTATQATTTLPAPVTAGGITMTQAVTSVIWTARPGILIGPGGFAEFTLSAGPVPAVDSLQFPATQTYDNGTVIRWDEPTPASGQEPLHPVPTLTITAGGAAAVPAPPVSTQGGTAPNDGPDTTAAVVAVIGVVVVAAAVSGVLALRGRRARPSAPRR